MFANYCFYYQNAIILHRKHSKKKAESVYLPIKNRSYEKN